MRNVVVGGDMTVSTREGGLHVRAEEQRMSSRGVKMLGLPGRRESSFGATPGERYRFSVIARHTIRNAAAWSLPPSLRFARLIFTSAPTRSNSKTWFTGAVKERSELMLEPGTARKPGGPPEVPVCVYVGETGGYVRGGHE